MYLYIYQVVSQCKVRTLEYEIYDNLRRKLKTYITEKSSKCSTLIKKFKDEVEDLCQHQEPAKMLSHYYEVADLAFDLAYSFPEQK